MPHSPLPVQRALLGVIVLAGLLLCGLILHPLFIDGDVFAASSYLHGGDFGFFWAAPQIAAHHITTLFSPPEYMAAMTQLYPGGDINRNELPYAYPLHSLFFYAPFAALPYLPALAVWTLSGIAAYGAAVAACAGPGTRRLAAAVALAAPAVVVCVMVRQNGLFIAAASLLVLLCLQRNRPVLAGILLGCLTLKPHLFVLWPLMLLVQRQWRCLAAASLTTVFLVGLSLAVHGVHAWQLYLDTVPGIQWRYTSWHDEAAGLRTFQLMMPGVVMAVRLLGLPLNATIALQCTIAALVMASTARVFYRRTLPLPLTAMLLASGGLLLTPYGYNYDLPLLSAAIILHWLHTPTPSWQRGIGLLGVWLAVLVYPLNFALMPLGPIILGLIFFSAVRLSRTGPFNPKGDS